MNVRPPFPVGDLVERACRLEVETPKPGNVHPGAAFSDTTYRDFVASAQAIRPVFDRAPAESVGTTVLRAVIATRRAVGKNTNLGIILALAPLARLGRAYGVTTAAERQSFRAAVHEVLVETTLSDAEQVYEAIRLASPGGLGEVDEADVSSRPTGTLLEMMRLAADRDLIARQYSSSYAEVVDEGLPSLSRALDAAADLRQSVLCTFLDLLSRHGDSLIERKCGRDVSDEAARRARECLTRGGPGTQAGATALAGLDQWLREEGNRRNPGTTADLTVAVLFLAMQGGIIPPEAEPSGPAPSR